MNGLAVLTIWTAAGAAIAIVAGWGPLQIWLESHEKLAAWVQAVFSVIAIAASGGVVLWQHRLELRRAKDSALEDLVRAATDILLMLQYVAAQLARTTMAANFQLVEEGNPVFYRDTSAEFRVLKDTLERLPFSAVTLHGQLDTYLCLRRLADELADIHAKVPEQREKFYKANRNRLEEIRRECGRFQISLADAIKAKNSALYEERKEDMLRM